MAQLLDYARLAEACRLYPKPDGFRPAYGTAGFRAEGSLLESTLFRCGVLMALRARQANGATGIVVTASHNPAPDNGVKLVDPTGYMLTQTWEVHADRLANAEGPEAVCDVLRGICEAESIPAGPARVLLGHDTRPSCAALVAAASSGIEAAGGEAEPRGLVTTPQLHWAVRRRNLGLPDSEEAYYETLGTAYRKLIEYTLEPSEPLHVDCANGVGAAKLAALLASPHCPRSLWLTLRNTGGGVLNGGCGADAVQKGPQGVPAPPAGFEDIAEKSRNASIDGDADRVVYFTLIDFSRLPGRWALHEAIPSGPRFVLLDGDRIAALAAGFVSSLVKSIQKRDIRMGVVQTAYANGSSTRYLKNDLGLEVVLAKTGVKHLHALAETFDIGIYFEANGHGTVLFSPALLEWLGSDDGQYVVRNMYRDPKRYPRRGEQHMKQEPNGGAAELLAVSNLVNQAVGDAISGILLVEAILRRHEWDMESLATMYDDLPSCMLKVQVPDRGLFTTSDAETKVVTPAGLQPLIDAAVQQHPKGRSFVRPSGTEDVVRVYAEAASQEGANALAQAVADLVRAAAVKAELKVEVKVE